MNLSDTTLEETKKEVEFLSRKILDLNKKLIESEKAKSGFLSLVASELNNPMTALVGLVPRLEPLVGSPQHEIFNVVYEQLLQLNFLIENIVAAAEIESGENTLSHARTHIAQIVEEIMNDFRTKTKEKNLLFAIEAETSDTFITDPKKLDLILKNLISNACVYADADSLIQIRILQSSNECRIEIENTGKGAEVEYEAELFNRFSSAPSAHHGLGLGLSIARHYAELLNGRLTYRAENGSVIFTIVLPLISSVSDSCAIGSDEFMFEPFDDAIEL